MFTTSVSAAAAWQRCEQLYDYRYRRRLRPKVQASAPFLGVMIHAYLEVYYKALRDGVNALEAQSAAIDRLSQFDKLINGFVATLRLSGADSEQIAEFAGLTAKAKRLLAGYYWTRGQADARQYEVIHVEHRLNYEVVPGVESRSVIDLVTRNRYTGRVALWEHKSTTSVPDSPARLRDLQTLLYATALGRQGLLIDEVVWNYIRTKEPVRPELLKSGHFSKDKRIDTTWDVYADAVRAAGHDPNAPFYADVKERLTGREKTVFYPRFEHVIVVDPDIVLRDYAKLAARMRSSSLLWDMGLDAPVRHLSRECDWCQFNRVCQAAITGGDPEDVIHMLFEPSKRKEEEEIDGQPAPDLVGTP